MTDMQTHAAPRWIRIALALAGVYNLAWGAGVVAFPNAGFDALGLERPNYPQIWQCVGMIVGVYGVGYLIAAREPARHWPIVLIGLLGKIFGPIGFVYFVVRGEFPAVFGLTIITNDLIWWIPFGAALRLAYRTARENRGSSNQHRDAMHRSSSPHESDSLKRIARTDLNVTGRTW